LFARVVSPIIIIGVKMNRNYEDILSKIAAEPFWWDENAVPRFCDFHPSKLDIYASEAAFCLISCQDCRKEFKVAFSWYKLSDDVSLHLRVKDDHLEYGDPPNINCCDAGPTMNSIMMQVLEFWQRDGKHDWVRNPELEIKFDYDW